METGDGGRVELLEVMGDDRMVANAARVSFGKWVEEFTDRDARLIRYLATHRHWSPFSHPQAQFRLTMPIFLARQWWRHQVGLTRNEISRRYVDERPSVFFEPVEWRRRAEDKKQGSGGSLPADVQREATRHMGNLYAESLYAYSELLALGVAPEQARAVLPQGVVTSWIETGSLYAYARLWGLRIAPDAQRDLLPYAQATRDLLVPHFPVSVEALAAGGAEGGRGA